MKIAKEYRWEMGHRLPFHKGLCRNIHGHSYKMIVEITGSLNKQGMVIDFFDLNKIIKPIIDKYDHAFLCSDKDKKLKDFLIKNKMKRVFVDYYSTVENICNDFIGIIGTSLKKVRNISVEELTIKIFETPNAYAEQSKLLAKGLNL
ncbi:MAG TPA: 6-pyruvoyl tetrahydropterin synthase family protein [Ignavibacteria bacterium]|nr:6-pyruvoyl tetrahydropterin synthase family protein [Ignavibacteria bacterium]